MRFLKRQTINRRQLKSTTVYSDVDDANVYINPKNSGSLVLPAGMDSQIPSSPVNGMMRYNAEHGEVQVYQSDVWRSLRFKEPSTISQYTLGYGDSDTVYFKLPDNVAYPTVQSGTTWGGQNLIVLVENVMQLHTTNYTVVSNPVIDGETYLPHTSDPVDAGETVINFNVSVPLTTVYPAVDITGAVVSGDPAIDTGSVILSYSTDSNGRLTQIIIDKPTISTTILTNTELTITDATNTGSGYYLFFSEPVPIGKPVTVLNGFDS